MVAVLVCVKRHSSGSYMTQEESKSAVPLPEKAKNLSGADEMVVQ
jgi:hypothetical protein